MRMDVHAGLAVLPYRFAATQSAEYLTKELRHVPQPCLSEARVMSRREAPLHVL